MNQNLVPVVLVTIGGLLLWASIRNKQPLDAMKALLSDGKVSDVGPIVEPASFTPSGNGSSKPGGVVHA